MQVHIVSGYYVCTFPNTGKCTRANMKSTLCIIKRILTLKYAKLIFFPWKIRNSFFECTEKYIWKKKQHSNIHGFFGRKRFFTQRVHMLQTSGIPSKIKRTPKTLPYKKTTHIKPQKSDSENRSSARKSTRRRVCVIIGLFWELNAPTTGAGLYWALRLPRP